MKRVAFTFIGKDRPGIIAGVTHVLFKSGCNIEDTTMTILEGEFAMILIASLSRQEGEGPLRRAFEKLKREWGLNYFVKPISGELVRGEKHPAGTRTYVVSVAGKDRTGIVYETSRILAKHKLNVTDLNSKILGKKERSVFTMILEVDVPVRFEMKHLEPEWRKLRKKLKVDVNVRPLERLSL